MITILRRSRRLLDHAGSLTERFADRGRVVIEEFIREVVEQIAFEARDDNHVDKHSEFHSDCQSRYGISRFKCGTAFVTDERADNRAPHRRHLCRNPP